MAACFTRNASCHSAYSQRYIAAILIAGEDRSLGLVRGHDQTFLEELSEIPFFKQGTYKPAKNHAERKDNHAD